MSIKSFFTNLINSLLDGSFERVRIINQRNISSVGNLDACAKFPFLKGEVSMHMK